MTYDMYLDSQSSKFSKHEPYNQRVHMLRIREQEQKSNSLSKDSLDRQAVFQQPPNDLSR